MNNEEYTAALAITKTNFELFQEMLNARLKEDPEFDPDGFSLILADAQPEIVKKFPNCSRSACKVDTVVNDKGEFVVLYWTDEVWDDDSRAVFWLNHEFLPEVYEYQLIRFGEYLEQTTFEDSTYHWSLISVKREIEKLY